MKHLARQNPSPNGKAIRKYRYETDLGLGDFAKAMSYSRQYIVMVENGRVPVTKRFLEKLRNFDEWYARTRRVRRIFPAEGERVITIVSSKSLPDLFTLEIYPVACLACGGLFVPRVPTQQVHPNQICRAKRKHDLYKLAKKAQ